MWPGVCTMRRLFWPPREMFSPPHRVMSGGAGSNSRPYQWAALRSESPRGKGFLIALVDEHLAAGEPAHLGGPAGMVDVGVGDQKMGGRLASGLLGQVQNPAGAGPGPRSRSRPGPWFPLPDNTDNPGDRLSPGRPPCIPTGLFSRGRRRFFAGTWAGLRGKGRTPDRRFCLQDRDTGFVHLAPPACGRRPLWVVASRLAFLLGFLVLIDRGSKHLEDGLAESLFPATVRRFALGNS